MCGSNYPSRLYVYLSDLALCKFFLNLIPKFPKFKNLKKMRFNTIKEIMEKSLVDLRTIGFEN